MSYALRFAAKSVAAAKAKIAENTTSETKPYGVPPLVAQKVSASLEKLGEPNAGEAYLVGISGHEAAGPGDYNDSSSTSIDKIGLAE